MTWNTPPELEGEGGGDEGTKSPTWTDPVYDAPWTTPQDLILDDEEADGRAPTPTVDHLPENMLKVYTPADEAFETIFHGVTMASLQQEWHLPQTGEDEKKNQGPDSTGESNTTTEDGLVQKVLRSLQTEDEMEEIVVEQLEEGNPSAAEAGARRGGDIQDKQRRTLRVGQMSDASSPPQDSKLLGRGNKDSTTEGEPGGESTTLGKASCRRSPAQWGSAGANLPSGGGASKESVGQATSEKTSTAMSTEEWPF